MRLSFAALTIAGVFASHPAAAGGRCSGAYAEDLTALSPGARELEARTPSYSYAVRTSATYECVTYGADAKLKTSHITSTAYGTAFGYRKDGANGADTLLITNQHVADWPAVTDLEHAVDGVSPGCRRISDSLRIVDNDHDDYADDDVPLTKVVIDPTLDVAILRAKKKLAVMPWKIGHSSAVTARIAVEVKGYPLGAFSATNIGKVVSAYDHDDYGGWNHDDFVVDALLTHGGSGSPVLAVSCKTGEWELVGIFHAHYNQATALNLIVAIDQVRDLMTTLKRSPKHGDAPLELDVAARTRLFNAANASDPPFFSFGTLTASVRARSDGALVFAVYPSDFPATTRPTLVIEDLPDSAGFGALGNVYIGGTNGLQATVLAEADAATQNQVTRALDLLRTDALSAFEYRATAPTAETSKDSYEKVAGQRKALGRLLEGQRDSVAAALEVVHQLKGDGTAQKLTDLETTLTPAVPASTAAVARTTSP